ncbi:MAG: hypothetical protein U9R53_04155 [Chloroflexota bacterium]|nr:hypothetical protein [Chloroflexota bacterium]
MLSDKKPTWHNFLLIGAFILALGFRFVRLGFSPLDDREASIALQALAAAEGTETEFGPFMSIVGLTGLDFFILSNNNFLARFWSALLGALIVFLPFLYRERLGDWPAIIASFILAISPDMVGLSRIIGSPMVACVCLLLSIGLVFQLKPIWGGIFLALGLMSGASFWMGLIILGLSWLISKKLVPDCDLFRFPKLSEKGSFWLPFGISLGMTLMIVSTSFFLEPAGVSGIFSGLVSFILGISSGYLNPFYLLPFSMLAYTGAALIFGVWGGLRGINARDKMDTILFIWTIVGLVFLLLYPGSKPADILWVTLPLWILTARLLFSAWRFPETSRLVVVSMAAAVIVLSAFMLLALRTLVRPDLEHQQQVNTLIVLIGCLVLIGAVLLLVKFGWGVEVSLSGILIGLVIVNVFALISISVNTTSLGPDNANNLWYPKQPQLSTEWLMVSIDRISDWNESSGVLVDVAVSGFDTPGMMWTLREIDSINFVPYLTPQSQSGIVITDDQSYPELANSYRGQDLVWSQEVIWEEMTPIQYLNWLVTRKAPVRTKQIILWVRTDLMADDQFTP